MNLVPPLRFSFYKCHSGKRNQFSLMECHRDINHTPRHVTKAIQCLLLLLICFYCCYCVYFLFYCLVLTFLFYWYFVCFDISFCGFLIACGKIFVFVLNREREKEHRVGWVEMWKDQELGRKKMTKIYCIKTLFN